MDNTTLVNTDKLICTSGLLKELFIDSKDLTANKVRPRSDYYLSHFRLYRTKKPLLALDYLIEANKVGQLELTSRPIILTREILDTINLLINDNDKKIDWNEIFKRDFFNSRKQQRKAAFILLHFISNDFDKIIPPQVQHFRIVEFLNRSLPDIGQKLHVDKKKQTFEQIKNWKDYGKSLFDKWNEIDIENPAKYINIREQLNHIFAQLKQSYATFINFEGFEGFPENLFSIIVTFERELKNGNFPKAKEELKFLKKIFNKSIKNDSLYTRYFVFPLLYYTLLYFNEKIKETNKPANLSIQEIQRKYPFFDKKAEIVLRVRIISKGGGFANNINLEISFDNNVFIKFESSGKYSRHWPQIAPGSITIEIPIELKQTFEEKLTGKYELSWQDWELKMKLISGSLMYDCETKNVNWTLLEREERYSTSPVYKDEDFAGKETRLYPIYKDIIRNLNSAWYFGQKRIGKTSTLLAIKRELDKSNDFIVAHTNYGEFGHQDSITLINQLVERLAKKIKISSAVDVELPQLNGSLAPLLTFIEEVYLRTNKKTYLLIDEFDELPYQFYTPNVISQPFWQTLRSISMSEYGGFLLVGGENVKKLKTAWGASLNLLRTHRADKFSQDEWRDYSELIKKPVIDELSYTDDAIQQIYNITGGNPFFTKLLCIVIQKQACRIHNSHISSFEVNQAINECISEEAEMDHFQHFIEDGLKGEEAKIKQWQQIRAKFLFYISGFIDYHDKAVLNEFKENCCKYGHISDNDFDSLNNEFQERGIYLIEDNMIIFNMPLFPKFLKAKGRVLLPKFFQEDEELQKKIIEEEKLRIKQQEIKDLLEKWGTYQGNAITENNVQNWLSQFGEIHIQRKVFDFLKQIKFVKRNEIINSLKYAYEVAISEIVYEKKGLPWKKQKTRLRYDIFISYLDGPGKSGAWVANQFKEVNQILKANILELTQLKNATEKENNPYQTMRALVLVDDFVGTGDTLCEELENNKNIIDFFTQKFNVKITLFAAFALEAGREKVLKFARNNDLNIAIHFGEILGEQENVFSAQSRYVKNQSDKAQLRALFSEYGERIVNKKSSLGYGNSQVAIVFPENCPNNSLPILWAKKESINFNWTPLFPRILG